MKNHKIKYSIAPLIVMLTLSACFNDLDVAPIDPRVVSSATVYETVDDYKQGLAKLYTSIALSGLQGPDGDADIEGIDEGFGTYTRALWNLQELSTDEAVISFNDPDVRDLHNHTWTATDVNAAALHSRIMYLATVCNEFIRAARDSGFEEVDVFVAEARFLRALAYWHMIDLFGTAPFVTEDDLPGSFFPERASRADLFAYIEAELIAIDADLNEPRAAYGRADRGAAWMLLSKLYLNAEVYIGEDHYEEAVNTLDLLLASTYEIPADHQHNFVADNHTSPEMIFPITFEGGLTESWGGMTYLIHGAMGGSMSDQFYEIFGVVEGWGGLRTTSALVNKFDLVNDSRAYFWTDGQSLEINDVGVFTDGYGVIKFINRKLDGSPSDSDLNVHVDTDYPMFRLGDAYLMYAEAVVRGGGGARNTALGYINELRGRANIADITDAEMTLDFILDERARELFWEGHRRTDLIRFGQFTDGTYQWPWKGGVAGGVATDGYRDVFPVPASQVTANPNLVQNEGY